MFKETVKDVFCREQCGAKAFKVLNIWRIEFFSDTLSSIMILSLLFLICKPQQLKSMFSLNYSTHLM